MIRYIASGFFLLSLASAASAQTVTDRRVWLTFTLQGSMSKTSRWRWSFDAITRSRSGVEFMDTSSVRPALAFSINAHSSVGGGYTWVDYYPAGGITTEQRIFGFYGWTTPTGGGTLSARVRAEARWFEHDTGVLWRVRPQAKFSHPIQRDSRVSVTGWDELDLHLNTTSHAKRGIDQNRVFGGVTVAWTPAFKSELGYLNQFVPGHGAANKMNHILSGTFTFTF